MTDKKKCVELVVLANVSNWRMSMLEFEREMRSFKCDLNRERMLWTGLLLINEFYVITIQSISYSYVTLTILRIRVFTDWIGLENTGVCDLTIDYRLSISDQQEYQHQRG